jgi:hypothetical protein
MFTYVPQKETGKESLEMLTAPFQWFGSIGEEIGDEVLDVTGSPNTAAFMSSLFKSIPALTALFAGTPGVTANPAFGYLARKKMTFPGKGPLSKKINAGVKKATEKQKYIKNLREQKKRLDPSELYDQVRSKIDAKLAIATGSLIKGKSYKTQRIVATGIIASRQYAKDIKDIEDMSDETALMSQEKKKPLLIPKTEKLDPGKSYRTFTAGPEGKLIRGVVTQRELDERRQKAIEKYGVKSKSGLSQFKYFTNYGGETIGYSTQKEYDDACRRFTEFGVKGVVGNQKVMRKTEADKDLFTKVFPFGREHKDPVVQDIKVAYDKTVKLSDLVASGEFKDAELGRYKLSVGKTFDKVLTSDEQKDFENKYKNNIQFILDKHMQAHKGLKNIILPPKQFLTEENTVLHNRIIEDAAITTTMLSGVKQYKLPEEKNFLNLYP